MSAVRTLFLTLLIVLVLVGSLSLYTVQETQRVIVNRLGQLIENSDGSIRVYQPGLHVKVPFIDNVNYLDRRIQTTELSDARMPTRENEFLIVSLFTKWKIKDFRTFYNASGTLANADRKIKEQLDEVLRTEVAKRKIDDLVWEGRDILMERIQDVANETANTLGVEIIDARVVRIDLPDTILQKVVMRMQTNIRKLAAERRTTGQREAQEIVAKAEKDANVIRAKATEQSLQLRGQGDAQAAKIYADAYKKDADFYQFYRRLEAYRETFKGNNDMLVLKPDDDFFKFFRGANSRTNSSGASGQTTDRAG